MFAIQVRKIGPSSVGIANGMLFVNKNMNKINFPASMVEVNKSITTPLHAPVFLNMGQRFPSGNQENQTADALTKALPQDSFCRHSQAIGGQ
jgi:hypothetical protein